MSFETARRDTRGTSGATALRSRARSATRPACGPETAVDGAAGRAPLLAELAPARPGIGRGRRPVRAFLEATRERVPGADIREAAADELPYADGSFASRSPGSS